MEDEWSVLIRGISENDAKEVGRFLDEAINLAILLQERAGTKKLKAFVDEIEKSEEVKQLASEVEAFASQFPIPGFVVDEVWIRADMTDKHMKEEW